MTVEIKRNEPVSAQELSSLYVSSGMIRPSEDLDRLQRMLDGADEVISAWEDGKLLGIVRAITDYAYCCYVSDVAVDSNYQRLGIGRSLLTYLIETLGDEISYVLTSTTKSMQFYEQIGFERAQKAFWITRKR